MKMTLTPLDSPLWEVYHGAYGDVREEIAILSSAEENAPQLGRLRRLDLAEKSDFHVAFDNLCENLSHQMTFYEANYLALPYIIKLLSRKIAENDFNWQVDIFSDAGCNLAADIPDQRSREFEANMPPEILESYRAAELRFKDYAIKFLLKNADKLGTLDEGRREFLFIGLLAVLGEHVAANALIFADDNYFCLACPHCDYYDEEVYIDDPDAQQFFAPAAPEPWDGQTFDKPQVWLATLLEKYGHSQRAQQIRYLYGTYTCQDCSQTAPMLEFAKKFYLDE